MIDYRNTNIYIISYFAPWMHAEEILYIGASVHYLKNVLARFKNIAKHNKQKKNMNMYQQNLFVSLNKYNHEHIYIYPIATIEGAETKKDVNIKLWQFIDEYLNK